MAATLIRIDRNGSKYFEGFVTCDRCGGAGQAEAWRFTGLTCYKCGGKGKVLASWIERTPEYQAKLDAKRAARHAKEAAERAAKEAETAAAQAAKEAEEQAAKEAEAARIAAQRAISQHFGNVGDKIDIEATYNFSAYYTVSFGWQEETMYIHNFTDANGNVFVWKTQKGCALEEGCAVRLRGTIKEHSEYKGEKQTALLRCKIERI